MPADFRKRVVEAEALPVAGREVDFLALICHHRGAAGRHGQMGEELLREVHEIFKRGIGPVEFTHGEFRIVAGVDAFVAENTADFVHAFHAADDEALEMELKGDAHVEVDIEGVVVGDERTRVGTAGDGVQHWGFDFEEGVAVEVAADGGDDFGAHDEGVLHVGIHDEVHVALAIAELGVGESVEFLWQWAHGFAEVVVFVDFDGELAAIGDEDDAGDADDVADVGVF